MNKPRYFRCDVIWQNSGTKSIIGHIYKVDDMNVVPNFCAYYDWNKVIVTTVKPDQKYFTEVSEEEYNIQEGINNPIDTYLIF